MRIKATIVAYAFSVQHFENATIEQFQVTSQLWDSVETCGKNLWHLYCITHKGGVTPSYLVANYSGFGDMDICQ